MSFSARMNEWIIECKGSITETTTIANAKLPTPVGRGEGFSRQRDSDRFPDEDKGQERKPKRKKQRKDQAEKESEQLKETDADIGDADIGDTLPDDLNEDGSE